MLKFVESEHFSLVLANVSRFIDKEMPRALARQWDRDNHFPADIHRKLAELGLMGLTVAEEYGGSGPDITTTIAVIELLCGRSLSVGGGYIQSACYAGQNIGEVGSEQQKHDLLPKVIEDGLIFAYGISEPDVGADVASVRTTGVREGGKVIVNGSKRFCSGAAISDYIYTLVRSGPKEDRYNNLSLLLIPPDTPGITLEPQETLGLKGVGTYDVSFQDVEIDEAQIVGGEEGWNSGWEKLIGSGLDIERLEVAAMALGIATAAVDDAWAYAQERVQFGKPICTIQSIRHVLADVKTKLEACRLVTYNAAGLLDQQRDASVQTAMAKLFVCDTALEIVIACQQIMGAYGYVKEFDMERYMRDVLVMPIIGGSSPIQKNNIVNRLKLPR